MKKILLIPLFLIFSVIMASSQTTDDSRPTTDDSRLPTPDHMTLSSRICALEQSALRGDSAAMYHLATLYRRGFDSIAPDSARAFRLLNAAANKGYVPAMNLLGTDYMTSPALHNPDSALFWLRRAAHAGDPRARNNVAFLILQDSAADSDELEEAVRFLRESAQAGVPQAAATLADLYRTGRGVEKDTLQAEMLYLQARSAGLDDAERKLMAMNHHRYAAIAPREALREGLRAAQAGAHAVAFRLFSRAAEDSIPRALALLGDAYASAKGTDYNHDKATAYFLRAALAGDPSARFIIAETLEIFPDALSKAARDSGMQIVPEMNVPQYWYDLAAEEGVSDAETALKLLFQ